MIQVLVTIAVVILVLFVLVLLICLMVWVVTKLLRFLFPAHFAAAPARPKKVRHRKAAVPDYEIRCPVCADRDSCPAVGGGVIFPCPHYRAETPEEMAQEVDK